MARRRIREVSLRIDDLDATGLGIGAYDGRTVKVRNALPGEQVDARVLKRYRGEWFAQAVAVAEPADVRVAPPCSAYPRCGGCSLQHMRYAAQLTLKHDSLLATLAAAGVNPATVRAPVASQRLHYRRKARLGVRCLGEEVLLGFRESYSSRVARLTDCKTLAYPAAKLIVPLRETLQALEAKARIPQIEVVVGEAKVAFVVRHLDPLAGDDRVRLAEFSARHGVSLYLQPGGYDDIQLLHGAQTDELLSYSLTEFGLTLQFSVTDFIQANASLNAALVSAATMALGLRPGVRVVDLFSGIGNFSLPLARRGARVTGIETAVGAVARARENAQRNGVAARCEFQVADLYDPGYGELGGAHLLLLDPPRTGAGPNLSSWLSTPSLQRAVYVSCNPTTFAADARVFLDHGFALAEVGIYDMFPQTAHVETLAVFARGEHG